MQLNRSARNEFLNPEVVAAYVHRPDYPHDLYQALLEIMPARRRPQAEIFTLFRE